MGRLATCLPYLRVSAVTVPVCSPVGHQAPRGQAGCPAVCRSSSVSPPSLSVHHPQWSGPASSLSPLLVCLFLNGLCGRGLQPICLSAPVLAPVHLPQGVTLPSSLPALPSALFFPPLTSLHVRRRRHSSPNPPLSVVGPGWLAPVKQSRQASQPRAPSTPALQLQGPHPQPPQHSRSLLWFPHPLPALERYRKILAKVFRED